MVNKISVLIIFYNEKRALGKTLSSIFSVDYPKKLIEVVCVDDGSTDGSSEVVKNYPVKLIRIKTKSGISAARNMGIKHCTGDYILFLDAHLYLKKRNTFTILCSLFSKYKNIVGVCGEYLSTGRNDKNYIRDIRRLTIFHKDKIEKTITLKNFTTWSIAIGAYKREIFKKNKFPEGFENSYGEDVYLQIVLHNQGYDFLYSPRIKGIHDAKIDSKTLIQKMIYEIRATGNILIKSSIQQEKLIIPFLNYFLSYPLFFILFLVGSFFLPKLFLLPLLVISVIEVIPALKVLKIPNYSLSNKLTAFFYLLIKEFTQGFYLPFYLLTKIHNLYQLIFCIKTIFFWEIKKLCFLIKNLA